MHEQIDLGSAPGEEDCAQVGREDYHTQARRECQAYIHQLRRNFGEEPAGARLSIRSNPHDFGSYLSVVCFFDPEIREAVEYAYRCEREGPREWDEQARNELYPKTKKGA